MIKSENGCIKTHVIVKVRMTLFTMTWVLSKADCRSIIPLTMRGVLFFNYSHISKEFYQNNICTTVKTIKEPQCLSAGSQIQYVTFMEVGDLVISSKSIVKPGSYQYNFIINVFRMHPIV